MSTDNPLVESADLFYGTTEESEPVEPTETDDVTTEAAEPQSPSNDESDVNLDDSDNDEESEPDGGDADGEQEERVYLELDGKDVDLDEVREWREGHMKEKDYRQKTMALADERKAVESQQKDLADKLNEAHSLIAELQGLVDVDDDIDWNELRETDPDEYINLKEKADKRKAAASKYKGAQPIQLSQDEIVSERNQLLTVHSDWFDAEGKQTDAYSTDMKRLSDYWAKNGFTQAETGQMLRARQIETCLKAAKWDELQAKAGDVTKKAKKATLVTKTKTPARSAKPKSSKAVDVFYNS